MKCRGLNLSQDFSGKVTLTVEVDKGSIQVARELYDSLNGLDLSVTIKQWRERRSLNANAYCWKLCTEIANILRSDKESVYVKMLKDYGQSEVVSVVSSVDVSGYFKYYDVFGTGSANGKEFIHYRVYKGSSEYDTKEMSILLDGIIEVAKEMGIQTETPDEICKMKARWSDEPMFYMR